jgi:flagellar biosynthesis/type III secretory pathway chaperone
MATTTSIRGGLRRSSSSSTGSCDIAIDRHAFDRPTFDNPAEGKHPVSSTDFPAGADAMGNDHAAAGTDGFDAGYSESMLAAALELAQRLSMALAAERETLTRRDLEKLRNTVEEKDRLVEMLAQMERSRALQFGEGDLLALDAATRARLEGLRNDLRNQLVRCREANQINARLVHRARQSVDEVLATLTGEHRHSTYGLRGSDVGGSTRVLGRA